MKAILWVVQLVSSQYIVVDLQRKCSKVLIIEASRRSPSIGPPSVQLQDRVASICVCVLNVSLQIYYRTLFTSLLNFYDRRRLIPLQSIIIIMLSASFKGPFISTLKILVSSSKTVQHCTVTSATSTCFHFNKNAHIAIPGSLICLLLYVQWRKAGNGEDEGEENCY